MRYERYLWYLVIAITNQYTNIQQGWTLPKKIVHECEYCRLPNIYRLSIPSALKTTSTKYSATKRTKLKIFKLGSRKNTSAFQGWAEICFPKIGPIQLPIYQALGGPIYRPFQKLVLLMWQDATPAKIENTSIFSQENLQNLENFKTNTLLHYCLSISN